MESIKDYELIGRTVDHKYFLRNNKTKEMLYLTPEEYDQIKDELK